MAAAVGITLLAACTGGSPTPSPPDRSRTGGPPVSSPAPTASPPPLRPASKAEAGCLEIPRPAALLRSATRRFMAASHGTVPIRLVHAAGRHLASLEPAFRADLTRRGPFQGGDRCLGLAARAEAMVGTALGPCPEIRLAAQWYALVIEFYPASPLFGEAQEYLLAQGFLVPSAHP
jgi:hypothetical protein